ncbi:MAG: hypothetical protein NVSMB53_19080 [Gemmatimonadaceae bacterium]
MAINRQLIPIVLLLAGCHSYAHAGTPEEAVEKASKTRNGNPMLYGVAGSRVCAWESSTIRITKTDHSVIRIKNPAIVSDSLIGIMADSAQVRVAIPLRDLSSIETSEINAGRTAAFGIVGLALMLGIEFALLFGSLLGAAH